MMRIKSNQKMLLLRYNNYKSTDFICEHSKCIQENHHVWTLKTGKMIPKDKIQSVIDDGGFIVLKAPKSSGGKYHLAHMRSSFNGSPTKEMVYPNYYEKMIADENLWMIDSLEGTWIEIDQIANLPNEAIPHIRLISNGKLADEVIKTTRSATMYVTSDIDFETEEF